MNPPPIPPVCTGGEASHLLSRRECLNRFALGLGGVALAGLLNPAARAEGVKVAGVLGRTHLAPRAKRIIYLFQSGGPSQLDLYDPKPLLNQRHGEQPVSYTHLTLPTKA